MRSRLLLTAIHDYLSRLLAGVAGRNSAGTAVHAPPRLPTAVARLLPAPKARGGRTDSSPPLRMVATEPPGVLPATRCARASIDRCLWGPEFGHVSGGCSDQSGVSLMFLFLSMSECAAGHKLKHAEVLSVAERLAWPRRESS